MKKLMMVLSCLTFMSSATFAESLDKAKASTQAKKLEYLASDQ